MSNIRVELQLEDGSFTTGIWRAGRSLAQFKEELARANPQFNKLSQAGRDAFLSIDRTADSTETLGKKMRNLSIMAGGVAIAFHALSGASNGIVGNIIRVNAEMEKLQYQLAGMSQAADPMKDAADQVERLRTLTTNVPFSIGAVTNSFVKMKAAGLDPMNGSLHALLDGMAAFGATDDQVNRVTVALTQMQGKGVLSMEELRQQLGESMPSAMRLMARSMGVSVGELTKMVSSGTVDSKKALDKWFREVENTYGGAGAEMMKSFSGQLARIKTQMTTMVTTGEMKGAFEQLKTMMGDFGSWLNTARAQEFFNSIGSGFQQVLGFAQALSGPMNALMGSIEFIANNMSWLLAGGALIVGGKAITALIGGMVMRYHQLGAAMKGVKAAALESIAATQLSTAASAAAATAAAGGAASAAAQAASAQAATAAGWASTARAGLLGSAVTAGSRFLGLLGPIGIGLSVIVPLVSAVATGFMDWKNGADAAGEASKTATQAARDQAVNGFEDRLAFLQSQVEHAQNEQERYQKNFGKESKHWIAAERQALRQIEKLRSDHAEELKGIEDKLAEEEVKRTEDKIREQTRAAGRAYDAAVVKAEDDYNKAVSEQSKSGASTKELKDSYHAQLRNAKQERLAAEAKLWDDAVKKAQGAAGGIAQSEQVVAALIEKRNEINERLAAAAEEKFGIDTLMSPESDEDKQKKLGKGAKDAAVEVNGLIAELNGASSAVGKLMFQIRRGDFGKFEGAAEDVMKLHDAIIQTTVATEALKELTDAYDSVDRELKAIADDQMERALKAQAVIEGVDPNNRLEMLKLKMRSGQLEGFEGSPEEAVNAAIARVTQGLNVSVGAFTEVKDKLQNETFGTASVVRINEVQSALDRVKNTTLGISGALQGVNFSTMGMPGFGTMAGMGGTPNVQKAVDGGILDLIAGPESGGDYNATLDNGLWTGGARNLTTMTLAQIRQLQEAMKTPANRAKYGDGKGSSALGRYQIVGATLQRLMDAHKLNPNALFDENMQDWLATQLAAETGGNAETLKKVWVGLQKYDNATISGTYARSMSGPTKTAAIAAAAGPNAKINYAGMVSPDASMNAGYTHGDLVEGTEGRQASSQEELRKREAAEIEIKAKEAEAAIAKMMRDLSDAEKVADEADALEPLGAWEAKARKEKAAGVYGGISDEDYARMIAAAKAQDAADQKRKDNKRDIKKLTEEETEAEQKLKELGQEQLDLLRQLDDPNFKGRSEALKKLAEAEAEALKMAERVYGKDSPQYKAVQSRYAAQRGAQVGIESTEALITLRRQREEAERASIVNENTARRAAFNERVKEIEALRDQAIQSGANVAEAQKEFDRLVAAERKMLHEDLKTDLERQIEQQGRLGENINKSTASWATSLSDNIYALASGQTNSFEAFGNAIRESIARSLSDKAAATLLKPFEQILGGDGEGGGIGGIIEKSLSKLTGGGFEGVFSGISEMLKSAMSGLGKMLSSMFSKSGFFPVKHTGGIVGHSGGTARSASLSNFVGAPKYHTGGIVGGPKFRKGLLPSEVPIIAQKGEGVFTKEQMKHMGGSVSSQQINISSPITVNASGGTPEQNADLAAQVAKQSEGMMRSLIQNELVRQMRPGGMMR